MAAQKVFLFFLVALLIGNVVFLDWVLWQDRVVMRELQSALALVNSTQIETPVDLVSNSLAQKGCDEECLVTIDKKIEVALATVSSEPVERVVEKTVVNSSATGSYYVPLGGEGSSTTLGWVDIPTSETTIDWKEYPGKKIVTWEAFAKVLHGNGKAMVRLYDKTNKVVVPESSMETPSSDFAKLTSGSLQVWSGKNTYVVQVNTLTGYEAFYEGGKIKIVVE